MHAKRLTYVAPKNAVLEACELAEPAKGSAIIRSLFSGISRGTESLVYKGLVPETEHSRMRCPHQFGEFTFPISYGYASVGVIEKIVGDVSDFAIGDTVFALHPHQTIFEAETKFCTKLPDNVPPLRAVLSANMETALNAIWDADLPNQGSFTVIGAGVVGLLTGYLIKKISNITPAIVDTNEAKRAVAEKLGLNFTHSSEGTIAEQSRIFNTSASEKGLQMAIDIAGFEAKIIEMSWYGDKPVSLNLGGSFHSKRLSIISSQVGHLARSKRETTSHADRMQQAIGYLDDPILDNLLEAPIDFEELPSHLHNIFSNQSDALCQVIKYKNA